MRKVAKNWLINTKEFISNDKGELVGLKTVEVENDSGQRPELVEKRRIRENLALRFSAIGLVLQDQKKKQSSLGLELDMRTN
jgi:glutamate synthase (NADPH/NADH) small chain